MIENIFTLCIILLGSAVLFGMIRLWMGPTLFDRMLAFDLVASTGLGMVCLLSARWHTALYIELLLVMTLLGFIGTVAMAFFASNAPENDLHGEGGVTQ